MDAVVRISELAGAGGSVLELGVGTGRLAVPLAERAHPVVGIDSSTAMLDRLADNAAHLRPGAIEAVTGDLADPSTWPAGPFSVVVAAFNLVCNLTDPAQQAALFAAAGSALAPGGHLVVETFVPAPPDRRERHLEVREVTATGVVLIASDTDPACGIVTGQHIELRDGEPVRLRPWRLRLTTPAELDRWATDAGLELVTTGADWSDPARTTRRDPRPGSASTGASDHGATCYGATPRRSRAARILGRNCAATASLAYAAHATGVDVSIGARSTPAGRDSTTTPAARATGTAARS